MCGIIPFGWSPIPLIILLSHYYSFPYQGITSRKEVLVLAYGIEFAVGSLLNILAFASGAIVFFFFLVDDGDRYQTKSSIFALRN
ncbi:MAG: hypothetical protein R3B93_17790 [Bacteroidia bacterium]